MGIADFIDDAVALLAVKKYESAMCLALNALDATARNEFPAIAIGDVGERCRQFVQKQYDIISFVGTAGQVCSMPGSALRWDNLPKVPPDRPGTLEDVLYFVVRCCLTHEAALPAGAVFNESCLLGQTSEGFSIPVHIISAVVLAVVSASTNAGMAQSHPPLELEVMGRPVPLGECWGQRDKLSKLIGMDKGGSAIGFNYGKLVNCKIG